MVKCRYCNREFPEYNNDLVNHELLCEDSNSEERKKFIDDLIAKYGDKLFSIDWARWYPKSNDNEKGEISNGTSKRFSGRVSEGLV